jgi:hypothetical protein
MSIHRTRKGRTYQARGRGATLERFYGQVRIRAESTALVLRHGILKSLLLKESRI